MKKLVEREWSVMPGVGSLFNDGGKASIRQPIRVRFEAMPKAVLRDKNGEPFEVYIDPEGDAQKAMGKKSKKLPLEREWLAFDPELDKKYYWANVLTMENGKVKVTQELREVK